MSESVLQILVMSSSVPVEGDILRADNRGPERASDRFRGFMLELV